VTHDSLPDTVTGLQWRAIAGDSWQVFFTAASGRDAQIDILYSSLITNMVETFNIIENKKNKTLNHNWAYYHTLSLTQFSITEIHNTIVIAYNRKYASLDG